MTFRHLEAFLAVARTGCVTRAAEALFLTQPTVSGQLRELEEELGVELFHRLPRGMELSEAGNLFLLRARELLDGRTRLLDEAAQYRGLITGVLEIHASNIPGDHLLPSALARFHALHPQLRLRCRILDSAEVLRLVAAGEASLGVVGRAPQNPDLSSIPLWEDRVRLFAPNRGGVPDEIDLGELAGLPLVNREEGSGSRRVVEEALSAAGFDPASLRISVEVGSATAVREAVLAGLGYAFLSEVAAEREVAQGLLKPVGVRGLPPVNRRFHLVYSVAQRLSPAALAFREFLAG
jgi:DNA-binding transcriptional LysR family regulator